MHHCSMYILVHILQCTYSSVVINSTVLQHFLNDMEHKTYFKCQLEGASCAVLYNLIRPQSSSALSSHFLRLKAASILYVSKPFPPSLSANLVLSPDKPIIVSRSSTQQHCLDSIKMDCWFYWSGLFFELLARFEFALPKTIYKVKHFYLRVLQQKMRGKLLLTWLWGKKISTKLLFFAYLRTHLAYVSLAFCFFHDVLWCQSCMAFHI